MVEQLRALFALSEVLGSIPSTHGCSQLSVTTVPRDQVPLPLRLLDGHSALTSMQAKHPYA